MTGLAPTLPAPDRHAADPSYRKGLDWLYGLSGSSLALRPDRQQAGKMERMGRLLEAFGNPHLAYPSVLVVGTKGKGSTAAILAEVLRAAGLRVGRYTQPHLVSWRERIWADGACIGSDAAARLILAARTFVERVHADAAALGCLTPFEVGTAIAFRYFQDECVDVAVVEAGVGGARDVTNLADVRVVALTPISLDHTDVLGEELPRIAHEKASVLRPGGFAATAPQSGDASRVVRSIADERRATLRQVGTDWRWQPRGPSPATGAFDLIGPTHGWQELVLPLLGRHQRDNATLAVAAAHLLENVGFVIPEGAVPQGLATVQWPGRLQLLGGPAEADGLSLTLDIRHSPPTTRLVLDGAHNAASAQRLAEALHECFEYQRLVLVLGMTEGKDVRGILRALGPLAHEVIVTRSDHVRAVPPDVLAAELSALGFPAARIAADVASALAAAREHASADDLVCVTGSLFLVGEVLERYAAQGDAFDPSTYHSPLATHHSPLHR